MISTLSVLSLTVWPEIDLNWWSVWVLSGMQQSQIWLCRSYELCSNEVLPSALSILNFWDLYIFSQEGRPATLHSISRNLMRRELSILTWEKLTASTQHPGLTVWLCRSCELWAFSNTLNIESSQSSQPGLTVWLCRSYELCSNIVYFLSALSILNFWDLYIFS